MEALDFNFTPFLAKRQYNAPKDSISLAEGMPNEVTFPFEKINVTLKDGSSFCLKGAQLNTALQYLPSQGFPPLVQLLKEFTQQVHRPPCWERSELLITTGSQDGISKSIEMCLQEGEPVVIQNPLYLGTEIIVSTQRQRRLAKLFLSRGPRTLLLIFSR